jgi:hypothetical protein
MHNLPQADCFSFASACIPLQRGSQRQMKRKVLFAFFASGLFMSRIIFNAFPRSGERIFLK